MRANEVVLNLDPILAEMRRLVHRIDPFPGPAAMRDTRFMRPQPLSADQMPRSSRKRSIGADDLIELMR